ncbi:unnamed protein product, partial [Closterium sp. NIES-64]
MEVGDGLSCSRCLPIAGLVHWQRGEEQRRNGDGDGQMGEEKWRGMGWNGEAEGVNRWRNGRKGTRTGRGGGEGGRMGRRGMKKGEEEGKEKGKKGKGNEEATRTA